MSPEVSSNTANVWRVMDSRNARSDFPEGDRGGRDHRDRRGLGHAAAWPAQLGANGRLVVSLRTGGMSRSWVLEHRDGSLVSSDHLMSGFVPMRGAVEHRGASVPLLGEGAVGLWQDERDAIALEELDALSGSIGT
jgi:hypothetical protein